MSVCDRPSGPAPVGRPWPLLHAIPSFPRAWPRMATAHAAGDLRGPVAETGRGAGAGAAAAWTGRNDVGGCQDAGGEVEYRGGVNGGRVPPRIGRMRRSCLWGATCTLVRR